MKAWKKQRQSEQKIGFRTVTTKVFRMPDGTESEWTTHGKPGGQSAATIALTHDNRVILARQFRPGPEMVMDELPGGAVNTGESPENAARRELAEETGYVSDEPLEYMGHAWRDAYGDEPAHYFLARNCYRSQEQSLEEDEIVEVITCTIDEYFDVVREARTSDAVALLLAYDELMEVRQHATESH